jgi:hypothetical protein
LSHKTELLTLTVDLDPHSLNTILPLLECVGSRIRDVVIRIPELDTTESIESLDLWKVDRLFCQPQFLHLQAIGFPLYERNNNEEVKRAIELNMAACLSRGILSILNT